MEICHTSYLSKMICSHETGNWAECSTQWPSIHHLRPNIELIYLHDGIPGIARLSLFVTWFQLTGLPASIFPVGSVLLMVSCALP